MSAVASPREASAPVVIENVDFPVGCEVSWDQQQLHFPRFALLLRIFTVVFDIIHHFASAALNAV